ncbi:MAG: glycoside hydrolase family 15 protein [Gammaproteobacteria bacterium]
MSSLDLGLIGNCSISALIDAQGTLCWACMPRFDADPVFCSLLRPASGDDDFGYAAIELVDCVDVTQAYLRNTAVMVTRLTDVRGGSVEIHDFAPRFRQFGRMFTPVTLVRRLLRVAGSPRVIVRVRPAFGYGAQRPAVTFGSHHIRYQGDEQALRVTTDLSITALLNELEFLAGDVATIVIGLDETVQESVSALGARFESATIDYWREWTRSLSIPFEWQDPVIRAAITLKLNAYDDTGAIIAAVTTSVPEAGDSGRTWDYRFCWLRDAYFVVNALNRLGTTDTLERYLGFIMNIAAAAPEGRLQPVYGIDGRRCIEERMVESLPGYRAMGPVRVGNQAHDQVQHDVYGSAILAAAHVFFDQRLNYTGDVQLFAALEPLGRQAVLNFDRPDASLWELRGNVRRHTFSAVLCWAACDRLAKIARQLGLTDRAFEWDSHARHLHAEITRRAWDAEQNSFVVALDGESRELDASLLLLAEFGFVDGRDPRFAGTVAAIERHLKRGNYIFRYVEADDFGVPSNAFLVCTFWYVYALCAQGRADEARALFEHLLACRNRHGLLAEHIDPETGEQWGNFVQTYSMVGLVNCAIRLSIRWDQAF